MINMKKNNSPSGGASENSSSNSQHNGIDGKRLNDLRNHLESESRRRRDQHSRKVRNGHHQMNNPNNGRNDENMDQSDEEVDYGDEEEEEIEAEDEEDGSLNSNQLEMLEKERMRTAAAIAYSRALRQQQKSSVTLNETGKTRYSIVCGFSSFFG